MAGEYGGIVVIKRNGKEGSVFPLQEEIIFGRYDSDTHTHLSVLFFFLFFLLFFFFFFFSFSHFSLLLSMAVTPAMEDQWTAISGSSYRRSQTRT